MTEKQMLEKVIEHPITSHALLEMLIEDGVKISVDPKTLTFSERKAVLRNILAELEKREALI